MARVSPTRFRTRNGQRRRVSWSAGPSGSFGAASASSVLLAPVAAQAVLDDLTVIRVHGHLLLYLVTGGGASAEGFTWAFGMCNVTENAAGIGVTAVPDPVADIAWDGWFVHEQGILLLPGTTLDPASAAVVQRVTIDSKAMRKTHESDTIVAVLGITETGEGSVMNASLETRILDKLP